MTPASRVRSRRRGMVFPLLRDGIPIIIVQFVDGAAAFVGHQDGGIGEIGAVAGDSECSGRNGRIALTV
jgi:hypothetical protein